jgi:hypothetical protein
MHPTPHRILTGIIGSIVLTLAAHGVWAQGAAAGSIAQAGDPARWYQEDINARERFETMKKEAGAAFRAAQSECGKMQRATRAACMQDARNTHGRDMADARHEIQSPRT